jgi:CHAT domain-containing protein
LTPEQRQERIARLEAEDEKLQTTISRRSEEFRVQSQPVTLDTVQQRIPADAALVEFFVYQPFDPAAKPDAKPLPERYVAYVLKHTGAPQMKDLGEAAPIDAAIDSLRQALRSPGRSDVARLSRALDEQVMQPVRVILGGTKRLLLSPDGELNLIPFAALMDERNEYLVKNYSISYLTSGRDLLRLQSAQDSKQPALALADPAFGSAVGTASANPQSARMKFNPLPGTAREARELRRLLPAAEVLTGAQATEIAVKRARSPRILHLATHGFFWKTCRNQFHRLARLFWWRTFRDARSTRPIRCCGRGWRWPAPTKGRAVMKMMAC